MTRRILSLCAGIGALERGLELAGLGVVTAQAELDPFCRRVLAKHYPDAVRLEDVRDVSLDSVGPADVVCGGFPCQPFSVAGKRLGKADERHIWPEFTRIIAEVKPSIGVFENVPGLRTSGLRDVLADLAALGFDVEWTCLRAGNLGAPHIRPRIFIVATHPDRIGIREQPGWLSRACESAVQAIDRRVPPDAHSEQRRRKIRDRERETQRVPSYADRMRRLESAWRLAERRGWSQHCGWHFDPFAPVDDGFAARLAGRIGKARKALGNAVVLPAALVVGRATVSAIGGAA